MGRWNIGEDFSKQKGQGKAQHNLIWSSGAELKYWEKKNKVSLERHIGSRSVGLYSPSELDFT